jgi:hypothetical protein
VKEKGTHRGVEDIKYLRVPENVPENLEILRRSLAMDQTAINRQRSWTKHRYLVIFLVYVVVFLSLFVRPEISMESRDFPGIAWLE